MASEYECCELAANILGLTEKFKMTVTMEVTEPQALALQAMFKQWSYYGRVGASRKVAFFVDGDGDFRPNCEVKFNKEIHELTEEMEDKSIVSDDDGNLVYDFDPIAWMLMEEKKN
jgi:hypothetical protein